MSNGPGAATAEHRYGSYSVNHLQDKQEANQVPYEVSSDLEEAKFDFVAHYNHRRYHNP